MAGILDSVLNYLKLGDEDYEEEEYEEESSALRKKVRQPEETMDSPVKNEQIKRNYNTTRRTLDGYDTDRKERTNSKVIPIRTTQRGLEVCIVKPTSFEDSQDVCDMLLSGRAAVVNLEGFDPDEAQRIMDFISGAVYAINGKLEQISRYIFIFSPETIDITSDYSEITEEMGFGVPKLNREF